MKIKLNNSLLAKGHIAKNPVGNEKGYWVGAPGAFYAEDEFAWYLTYRIRRPRGVEPDRGGEARIARSTDLTNWEDIWTVTKDKYESASIERSAIRKGKDGLWRYFTSYVHPKDGKWCVAVMKATDPKQFDPAKREVLFTAESLQLEGVKDPWIFEQKGIFYMILSVAIQTPKTSGDSHSTLDIFNTGECVSATALATSRDLDKWEWQGVIFKPEGNAWDCYCRRINSIVPSGGRYFAFYDGSASHLENYEEKTGLAVSNDLKNWKSITQIAPAYISPHGSTSLRYIDAQTMGGQTHIFYEFAREDGAHDMRVVEVNDLPFTQNGEFDLSKYAPQIFV
ncbi:MAG: hypothetical protein JWM68_287 [Verrucomicrobiales bacterium]|nr:hypothetical protein [Verrucomicrobiales bacterium]